MLDEDTYKRLGKATFESWLSRFNKASSFEEVIKDSLYEAFSTYKEDILYKCLGFTNRWGGKWEIDRKHMDEEIAKAAKAALAEFHTRTELEHGEQL